MHPRERERAIVENADIRAREADGIMTRDERMEIAAMGRRTKNDVKVARELLKDDRRR